jgi:predicted ArsR family transcriptional regulator
VPVSPQRRPGNDVLPDRDRAIHAALAVPSRADLLEQLQASDMPLDVDQLAELTGLHRNTVRFHLDVLVAAGLATSQPIPRPRRGRPRYGYDAVHTGGADGTADYRLLAEALTTYLASRPSGRHDPGKQAGRLLGKRLGNPFGTAPTSAAATARYVDATFSELGFDSHLTRRRDGFELALHSCPFRDLAAQHRDVVCGMHAGLLEQTVIDIDSPVTRAALTPFVEPQLCVARLWTTPRPAMASRPS